MDITHTARNVEFKLYYIMKEKTFMQKAMEVINLAASAEQHWANGVYNMSGYKRKTTFFSDLCIAEMIGGADSVKETYTRVMKEWITNVEYITEFIMVLNHKCWIFYEKGMMDMSKLYHDLYHDAYGRVAEHYDGDEKASRYIFETLD